MKLKILSINRLVLLLVATLFFSSCSKKTFVERSTYYPGNEPLTRSDYKIVDNARETAEVTTWFGLANTDNRHTDYRFGADRRFGRGLTSFRLGVFNVNFLSVLSATALSIGFGGTINAIAPDIPLAAAIVPGAAIGLSVNNLIFGGIQSQSRAQDLVNYRFIENNDADFLVNPRYKVELKKSFYTTKSKVTLTSKGMKIIPDIILSK